MKMQSPALDCPRCQKTGKETFRYVTRRRRFEYDVDRAWEIVHDGREPIELDPESVEWCVRTTDIDEPHLDHVDPTIPGLIAHVWLRMDNGEIARGHLLIDGNHRAARCHRDQKPFFVYLLTEEESDAILLHNPNRKKRSAAAAAARTR